jgi:hypothetical protein
MSALERSLVYLDFGGYTIKGKTGNFLQFRIIAPASYHKMKYDLLEIEFSNTMHAYFLYLKDSFKACQLDMVFKLKR